MINTDNGFLPFIHALEEGDAYAATMRSGAIALIRVERVTEKRVVVGLRRGDSRGMFPKGYSLTIDRATGRVFKKDGHSPMFTLPMPDPESKLRYAAHQVLLGALNRATLSTMTPEAMYLLATSLLQGDDLELTTTVLKQAYPGVL